MLHYAEKRVHSQFAKFPCAMHEGKINIIMTSESA